MHKLLERQIRTCFGSIDCIPVDLQPFIRTVERAYEQSDDDRWMLEHSLETVSEELVDRFRRLQEALAESRKAEARLSEALSILTATLESTTDGILVVDTDGRMIQMNRRFIDMWHLPDEVVESRDDNLALEYVTEQLREPEEFHAKIRHLYDQPLAESFDVVHFKDGRVFERYSLPQRVNGRTVGRVWSFRDVTGKLELEGQLRQSQKMDAIGQLAGGVAHDFNNLLTVIINYVSMLQDDDLDAETTRAYLSESLAAAERAARLTSQLLAFSRRQMLQPRVLELNAIIVSLLPMLQRIIGEDIRIATNTDPKLGAVLADQGQIEQVILNLAVNARDAMPGGGTISIETSNVELSASNRGEFPPEAAGSYAMISVADTGTGMDAETRARIFEPFFTTKEPGRGTGLGLATVYGIVKQSDGFVRVHSELGAGTTIGVYLPHVAAVPAHATTVPRKTEQAGGTETILLVEDEDSVRRLVVRALTRRGYTVIEARTGAEAVRLAHAHGGAIDLVMTDVVMPEMNGSQLVQELSGMKLDVRVIYMSGYTDDDIVRRGLIADQQFFVQKPFTTDALLRKVREVLDIRR